MDNSFVKVDVYKNELGSKYFILQTICSLQNTSRYKYLGR